MVHHGGSKHSSPHSPHLRVLGPPLSPNQSLHRKQMASDVSMTMVGVSTILFLL